MAWVGDLEVVVLLPPIPKRALAPDVKMNKQTNKRIIAWPTLRFSNLTLAT